MGKDLINAEKQLDRANLLYRAEQFKKAGKMFNSAGESFFKAHEYKAAKNCFFNAAISFSIEYKITSTIEALRNAGNTSLLIDEYSDANRFFKKALNYVSDLRRPNDRNLNYILFSSLSFLCLFIEGKQDQGLTSLKQIKKCR